MSRPMPIRALAPWFGAKRTLASRIIQEFGPHSVYWEPTAGSCAVLLAKKTCMAETVNDLHGGITCLARTLADFRSAAEVYRRLAGVICSEQYWRECREHVRDVSPDPNFPDPIWAAEYLVASWMARNSYGGTDTAHRSFAARFSATGGSTAGRWRAVVDSIPAWHERIRNVTILNRDCLEVISRIDDAAGTVIYVDPPYIVEGNRYDHKFTWEQHCQLQLLLRRFTRARVLVSYFKDRRLDDLYAGWTLVPMDAPKFLAKAGRREASSQVPMSPEVLFINGPSIMDDVGLFAD
jgi:DNA adenine methylase